MLAGQDSARTRSGRRLATSARSRRLALRPLARADFGISPVLRSWRGHALSALTSASNDARPSTDGCSTASSCATPMPPQTSTTSTSSRPSAACTRTAPSACTGACLYEVDPILVGENVILRYDPEAPPSRPLDVVHEGKPAGHATRLDAYANASVKRGVYSESAPARPGTDCLGAPGG